MKDLRLETPGRLVLAASDDHDEAQLSRDLVVKGVFSYTQLVAAAPRVQGVTLRAAAVKPYAEVCTRGVLRERAAAMAREPAAEGLEWKVVADKVRKHAVPTDPIHIVRYLSMLVDEGATPAKLAGVFASRVY